MIDARGLSCPIPVVMVQKEWKTNHPAKIEVLVDNQTAVENITRFGENHGYTVTSTTKDADLLVVLAAT